MRSLRVARRVVSAGVSVARRAAGGPCQAHSTTWQRRLRRARGGPSEARRAGRKSLRRLAPGSQQERRPGNQEPGRATACDRRQGAARRNESPARRLAVGPRRRPGAGSWCKRATLCKSPSRAASTRGRVPASSASWKPAAGSRWGAGRQDARSTRKRPRPVVGALRRARRHTQTLPGHHPGSPRPERLANHPNGWPMLLTLRRTGR